MGLCSSCFKGSSEELITPDAAIRRQQQLDAAERRKEQNETRGIKDPEKVRRMQQKAEETARREQEAARMGQGGLRVTNKQFQSVFTVAFKASKSP